MSEISQSIYKELGRERKKLQEEGRIPDWYTTGAYQMFKEKYASEKYPDVKSTFERIAKQASKWIPENEKSKEIWREKFFNLMWRGWLAPSTPVMSNMGYEDDNGNIKGCSVSCSGGYIADSVYSFYESQKEAALLSKNGFGTSGYLGGIRSRGETILGGGKASGVVPVFKDFVQLSRDISQGSTRRGAWAGYLEIDHNDFWELCNYVLANPDDANIGWIISNEFVAKLDSGDVDALERFQKAMKLKMITGKGYFFFVDKVNELSPQCYKDRGLKVHASNLCLTGDTQITVFGDNHGMKVFRLDDFINEWYSKDNWKIWSKNIETYQNGWKYITDGAMTNPKAKLMKITDEETGKSIRCTPDHQVFTKNRGYVMAKDLKEDDELVIG